MYLRASSNQEQSLVVFRYVLKATGSNPGGYLGEVKLMFVHGGIIVEHDSRKAGSGYGLGISFPKESRILLNSYSIEAAPGR